MNTPQNYDPSELADALELAGASLGVMLPDDLSRAGRLIRHAVRLVDALGLDHVADDRGIEVVLAELVLDTRNAARDLDLEPEPVDHPEPRPLRLDTYRDTAGEHRWRVVHTSNGETLAAGEGYTDRRDRDHAARILVPDLDPVDIDRHADQAALNLEPRD